MNQPSVAVRSGLFALIMFLAMALLLRSSPAWGWLPTPWGWPFVATGCLIFLYLGSIWNEQRPLRQRAASLATLPPDLVRSVEEVAQSHQLPLAGIYASAHTLNAQAIVQGWTRGRLTWTLLLNPQVYGALPPAVQQAVLLHEAGHVYHRHRLTILPAYGAWALGCLTLPLASTGFPPLISFFCNVGGFITLTALLSHLVLRHREYEADSAAARWLGNPTPLLAFLEQTTLREEQEQAWWVRLPFAVMGAHPPARARASQIERSWHPPSPPTT